ncbi:MAG: PAS domain S-box protein, partial [Fuerstia sp.]|nr:PAS domain S-box protein [Fuerstiella sp.]
MTENPLTDPDSPRLLAYVCGADSCILSSATMKGDCFALGEGNLLLDACSAINNSKLSELWHDLTKSGLSIHAEVGVSLTPDSSPLTMLLHAMPLHFGLDEGKFLVTLCSGFRPVSSGPDEVARSRAVLNTAVDSIITIDHQCLICSVNPATERMFGYGIQELLGSNINVLMPEPDRSQHDSYVARYIESRKPSIIGIGRRITGRRKDGVEFPAHLAVSEFAVRGKQYFTGIIRDLSELERVQKQLLQVERLAAIGQMVTGLAHESRNALQRAQACLDILSLDLKDNQEQLDLARRATMALQDLYRLYEEVRGYAAPIHLEFRECDLTTICYKEWENLAAARKGRQIELVDAPDSQHLNCEVDVHRVEQVLRNVLENAIHACGNEGTITVSCKEAMCGTDPAAMITIDDDGSGMTQEIANQIFEPFFTTKQKGTGLGMAIVHRIMTAHGGSVMARPLEHGGSQIVLLFPRTAAILFIVGFLLFGVRLVG